MKITDSVMLGDVRLSDRGFLEANVRTARTGIQTYLGSEVGRPDLKTVNVYRDEAEVFSKASLQSFSKIPVTLDHPPEAVNSANWAKYAKGTTGDEVLRDGEFLKIGLKVTDGDAVKAIKDGKRELSVGYTTELLWEDGVTPDGVSYQARQTKITADHIAIVTRGRAGSECRIGDTAPHAWGVSPVNTNQGKDIQMGEGTLRTVDYEGVAIQTTDQGAQVIERLKMKLDAAEKLIEKLQNDAGTPKRDALAEALRDAVPLKADDAQARRDATHKTYVDRLTGVAPQKGA